MPYAISQPIHFYTQQKVFFFHSRQIPQNLLNFKSPSNTPSSLSSFKTVVTTPPLTKKSISYQYFFTHHSCLDPQRAGSETHPASPWRKIGQALVETRTPIGTGALSNSSRLTNSRRRRSRVYRSKIPGMHYACWQLEHTVPSVERGRAQEGRPP